MKKTQLRVGTPCTLDWQAMTPAEGGRFCGDCKKVVRNVSAMTEDEAKALFEEAKTAELCVRYVYDRDGEIRFAPEPRDANLVPASFLHRAKRTAAAAFAAAAPLALAACSPSTIAGMPYETQDDELMETMGAMEMAPRPETDAGPAPDADASPPDAADRPDADVPDAAKTDAGDAGPGTRL